MQIYQSGEIPNCTSHVLVKHNILYSLVRSSTVASRESTSSVGIESSEIPLSAGEKLSKGMHPTVEPKNVCGLSGAQNCVEPKIVCGAQKRPEQLFALNYNRGSLVSQSNVDSVK